MTRKRHRTHRTSTAETIAFARELRRNRTVAEMVLWARLRRKALGGFRFRQQHPIGPYIADFYCDEAGLVVEVDGDVHDEDMRQMRDRYRDLALTGHGLEVLRFDNEEVLNNTEEVVATIQATLGKRVEEENQPSLQAGFPPPTTNRKPGAGGGWG